MIPVDHVLYINLEYRTDRKEHLLLLRVIYVNESDESSDHRGTVWEVT